MSLRIRPAPALLLSAISGAAASAGSWALLSASDEPGQVTLPHDAADELRLIIYAASLLLIFPAIPFCFAEIAWWRAAIAAHIGGLCSTFIFDLTIERRGGQAFHDVTFLSHEYWEFFLRRSLLVGAVIFLGLSATASLKRQFLRRTGAA